ncbi:TetR/AcrR family transcriptional regulator [Paenibacillus sp. MER 180]|uniref:TetR/AcrR family transcriptional regulator n=1 Tax=Paenibacillus sp. MER 180 TaxID=2939570 RepID=UPI00203ABB14|nr:TetR/AcrR family transcriptional regulator [Paenibacillus sp. MER 180]MCM3292964.1 TetR/AcrR family transcriptional regulator [Paenibacillus sp. MER 180]
MSPKDPSLSRKDQIIDAAVSSFAEHGFYKTTTAKIAKSAGVTQPYVFHFFKSKEELFIAVLDRATEKIEEAFSSVDAPPEQFVETMGRAFGKLIETHRDEMLVTMQAFTTSEPAIRDSVRDHFTAIHQTVIRRFEQAGIPNAKFAASMFIGSGLIITMSEVLEAPNLSPWPSK